MNDENKKALERIAYWAETSPWASQVDGSYVFGTLVHRDGAAFGPLSDIDIAIVASHSAVSPLGLFGLTQSIRETVCSIEGDLVRILGRSGEAPICSISLIGCTDAYHSIHKGKDVALLSAKRFIKLSDYVVGKKSFCSIAKSVDESEFYAENADTISTIEFAQAIRNEYLCNSFNGRTEKIKSWGGSEPIPKRLARQAAILGWRSLGEEQSRREDINVGLRYIGHILQEHVANNHESNSDVYMIRDKIEDRQARRSSFLPELTSVDQVVLSEILYYNALLKLKPSTRSILDSACSAATACTQASSENDVL